MSLVSVVFLDVAFQFFLTVLIFAYSQSESMEGYHSLHINQEQHGKT